MSPNYPGRWKFRNGSRILFAPVFPGAPILHKLNNEENNRSHQKEMDHAALVQQEFSYDPEDQHQTASKPQHVSFGFERYAFEGILRL